MLSSSTVAVMTTNQLGKGRSYLASPSARASARAAARAPAILASVLQLINGLVFIGEGVMRYALTCHKISFFGLFDLPCSSNIPSSPAVR